ncbi:microsomal glutathione S-transferase 1-like [Contarinia nasturtii]|uniref:microsomal glutathione S-transferase 1-like n=1 Tax=Contarinia nasturtii TaxID=265458 RepID=UPI0012D42E62|nr:microsomal glutathione S-transferase 1-like [Contarinia nasturtii]
MAMESFVNLLSFSNPVFSSFAFWGSILVIKCLFMSTFTGLYRWKNGVTSNPEDVRMAERIGIRGETKETDPDVDRARRAHLNDLENILPYLIVGSFYVLTNPSLGTAKLLFQVATIARIIHTFVYAIFVIPQPSRLLSWLVHYLITLYMAVMVVIYSYNK